MAVPINDYPQEVHNTDCGTLNILKAPENNDGSYRPLLCHRIRCFANSKSQNEKVKLANPVLSNKPAVIVNSTNCGFIIDGGIRK
jgi:hypothetical protein